MKLEIKNFEKLKKRKWDDKNFIEDVRDRDDEYVFYVWRDGMRKIVVLEANPIELNPSAISDGIYEIGVYDTDNHYIPLPYWIEHSDIENIDIFMDKLKTLTDKWQPKII